MNTKENHTTDNNCSLKEIFLTFLYSGLILLGGGYVILPVLQKELVEKRQWLTNDELTDYYAISQSMPGLIAINISILVGYKLKGKLGAIAGVCGITFFAFWAIVTLSTILTQFTANLYVKGAFWGVGTAVIVLIISAVREMWNNSIKDITCLIIYIFTLLVMLIFDFSPVWLILLSIFFGIGYKSIERHRRGAD